MPLKLNVGLSKKVGLPDYGSLGASCHVELELNNGLLQQDPKVFQAQVRGAYTACREAVESELAAQQSDQQSKNGTASRGNGASHGEANGNGNADGSRNSQSRNGATRSHGRRATVSQVRAIHAIADRNGIELTDMLHNPYGVDNAESLTITEASRLIDELKGTAAAAGGQA